jgi:hypothetical protein
MSRTLGTFEKFLIINKSISTKESALSFFEVDHKGFFMKG